MLPHVVPPPPRKTVEPIPLELELPLPLPPVSSSLPGGGESPGMVVVVDLGDTGDWIVL
jgi:hypothetical protein